MTTILAASTAYQKSRLGTTLGKGYYSPNVRVDGLGATCSPLGLLPGAAPTKGCWIFFLRTRLCTVRNYYWSEQNKTEKPSDEPPTDKEHRPGDRADQAHRAQLNARKNRLLRLPFVGKSSFRFCFLNSFILKQLRTLATAVCCLYCTALCRKCYLLERRLLVSAQV